MEFAYLDESGDLGSDGSKWLILTLICTKRKKELVKIIKDVKKELLNNNKSARWLKRNGGEIKYYNFPDTNILKRTLKKISKVRVDAYYVALKKNKNHIPLQIKTTILKEIFQHIKQKINKKGFQKIIADLNFFNDKKVNRFLLTEYRTWNSKSKNYENNINFEQISNKDYEKIKDNMNKTIFIIEHKNSSLNEELQALDLICGSIFSKFERNNSYFVKLLESDNFKIRGRIKDIKK